MTTVLSYQHQLNTIRALTSHLRFFGCDQSIYSTSVLEEYYRTLTRKKKLKNRFKFY